MATVEYFDMTPADMARNHNLALEATLAQLVNEKLITDEQAEKFANEYTFVAVRSTSVTNRIKRWLFSEKDITPDSYKFPLVKISQ